MSIMIAYLDQRNKWCIKFNWEKNRIYNLSILLAESAVRAREESCLVQRPSLSSIPFPMLPLSCNNATSRKCKPTQVRPITGVNVPRPVGTLLQCTGYDHVLFAADDLGLGLTYDDNVCTPCLHVHEQNTS